MFLFKEADTDENEEVGAEPPDNAQFSVSNEDKILNNGKCNLIPPLPEFRA